MGYLNNFDWDADEKAKKKSPSSGSELDWEDKFFKHHERFPANVFELEQFKRAVRDGDIDLEDGSSDDWGYSYEEEEEEEEEEYPDDEKCSNPYCTECHPEGLASEDEDPIEAIIRAGETRERLFSEPNQNVPRKLPVMLQFKEEMRKFEPKLDEEREVNEEAERDFDYLEQVAKGRPEKARTTRGLNFRVTKL
jgi:hypothetical protein